MSQRSIRDAFNQTISNILPYLQASSVQSTAFLLYTTFGNGSVLIPICKSSRNCHAADIEYNFCFYYCYATDNSVDTVESNEQTLLHLINDLRFFIKNLVTSISTV